MKLHRIYSSLLFLTIIILLYTFTPEKILAVGQWNLTGSMLNGTVGVYSAPASGDPLVTLLNGKAFSNGTLSLFGGAGSVPQIYDPSNGQWSQAGTINEKRVKVEP